MKKIIAAICVLGGVLIGPGTASAHFPQVSGTTVCREVGGDWTVNWVVTPDQPRPNETWEVTSPSGYSQSGSQPAGSAT